jgi:hypothetical protein
MDATSVDLRKVLDHTRQEESSNEGELDARITRRGAWKAG